MNRSAQSNVPSADLGGASVASGGAAIAAAPYLGLKTAAEPRREAVLREVIPTDEVLFARAAGGNRDALGELIQRYEQILFGLLARLTNGDMHRADDLFQDTFLHAMRAAASFDQKMHFKPWITTIAVNLVRDEARKRKVRGEIALDGGSDDDAQFHVAEPVSSEACPRESAERLDEQERVQRALGCLTLAEREVILLHFFNDMTLVETADSLKIPLGTVKSRLHAALTRLSKVLG